MTLKIKILPIDYKYFRKLIGDEIKTITNSQRNLFGSSKSSVIDGHVSTLISVGLFLKSQKLEALALENFSNCAALKKIVLEEDRKYDILIDFNNHLILNHKFKPICGINPVDIIKKISVESENGYFMHYDIIPDFKQHEGMIFHNEYYDFHIKISTLEERYDEISNKYNLFICCSTSEGAIRGLHSKKKDFVVNDSVTIELVINHRESSEKSMPLFSISKENIDEQLSEDGILFFLYKKNIYSSINISDFDIYKKHILSISEYTKMIQDRFLISSYDGGFSNEPSAIIDYEPQLHDYASIVDGNYRINIRNVIGTEQIFIDINILDIAYCNIDKILINYYLLNKDLNEIVTIDEFINHTKDSLQHLIIQKY